MSATNSRIMTIGPKKATELLAVSRGNRPINIRHVDALAAAMANGEWVQTGDPIRLTKDGYLQDGQHRLSAIVKSGKTIEFYVVAGLSNEAFDFIDIGLRRNHGQMLARNGELNYNQLAAAILWFSLFEKAVDSKDTGIYAPSGVSRPRMAEVRDILSRHPDLRTHVSATHGKQLIPGGAAAALRYIFSRKDDALAAEFFESLYSGENLKKSSPIYALRERLIADLRSRAKLPTYTKVIYVVKAWNLLRRNTPCKPSTLRVCDKEAVPKIE